MFVRKRKRPSDGFDTTNRPQNRPLRDRKKIRRPRSTNLREQIQFDKNNLAEPSLLAKRRNGYTNIFKVPKAKQLMLELGFKAPGQYRWNQQGNTMPALPSHIPKSFNDDAAGWVARHCYMSRKLTKSNMEAVRLTLSFFYQLQTGKKNTQKVKANYPSVYDQFGCHTEEGYAEQKRHLVADHSVEPEGMKTAWNKEWTPESSTPYPEWCVQGLISWDWSVDGCRGGPKGGLLRLQKSREHKVMASAGVMMTKMKGGRPKIPGVNKRREWWNNRICLCEDGKHVPPPEDWTENLDENKNPLEVTWCTLCPLNMFQSVQDLLPEGQKGRMYPKWSVYQKAFGKCNFGKGKLVPQAQAWYDEQGGNPDNLKFGSNSGRKACGKWCAELHVKYSHSFQLTGDLWSTWVKYYQFNLDPEPEFGTREQSKNVDIATRALWIFARWIGRGRLNREDPVKFNMDQIGRMLALNLRANGMGAEVAQILRT